MNTKHAEKRALLFNRIEKVMDEFTADWQDRWFVGSVLLTTAHVIFCEKQLSETNGLAASLSALHVAPKQALGTPTPVSLRARQARYAGDEYLTERELAELLNVSLGFIRKWRMRDKGPKVTRVGRLVRYRYSDIEAFLRERDGSDAI